MICGLRKREYKKRSKWYYDSLVKRLTQRPFKAQTLGSTPVGVTN